jgi:restriction system protein
LELYRDGEQTGQQYPAGTWSIDFLAADKKANELVVIELKRGQTSDATVGQVLRYMSWVRENVATEGQSVRGIIVASEIDDALRYAARGLPNVSVKTYTVTFSLQSADI